MFLNVITEQSARQGAAEMVASLTQLCKQLLLPHHHEKFLTKASKSCNRDPVFNTAWILLNTKVQAPEQRSEVKYFNKGNEAQRFYIKTTCGNIPRMDF